MPTLDELRENMNPFKGEPAYSIIDWNTDLVIVCEYRPKSEVKYGVYPTYTCANRFKKMIDNGDICPDDAAQRARHLRHAYYLARSDYQRKLVTGEIGFSEGKKNKRHAKSVISLLKRLDEAGIPYTIEPGPRWSNARIII